MSAGKIIGYVVSGILVLFGVLYLLSAFSAQTLNPVGRLVVGAILVLVGLGIIVIIKLREPKAAQEVRITQELGVASPRQLITEPRHQEASMTWKEARKMLRGSLEEVREVWAKKSKGVP